MIQHLRNFEENGTCFVINQTPMEKIIRRSFTPVDTSITPYKKPTKCPSPELINGVTLENDLLSEVISKSNDWIWLFARYQCVQLSSSQTVPGWSGFHSKTMDDNFETHRVSFLPAINQSPTELDTVHEVLQQVKRKTEILNVQSADLVLDHAIFIKALDILNNPANEDLKASISIRMGGFHACCILLAVIGKCFASESLRDIEIESGLVGPDTVKAVFKGKPYNYVICMIKIVLEALFWLKIDALKDWLIQKGKEEVLRQFLNSEEVIKLIKNSDPAHHRNTQWSFESLNKLLISFEEEIRQNIFGPATQFWQSVLDMSQVLLDYIKSFRIGDWQLHSCSMEKNVVVPCL